MDTGWLSFSTFASISLGAYPWASPGNAISSNNVYASCPSSGEVTQTDYLRCTNSSPLLPNNAAIKGIEISIEKHKSNSNLSEDYRVYLCLSGTTIGVDRASTNDWPTSDSVVYYGGSLDLWDVPLSVSDVNDSTFGVQIAAYCLYGYTNKFYIDHIAIKIYYSLLNVSDLGTGTDDLTTKAVITSSDSGIGADSQSLVALLSLSDLGGGADYAIGDAPKYTVSDLGAGIDTAAMTGNVVISETGLGTDIPLFVNDIYIVTSSDIATGKDRSPWEISQDYGIGYDSLDILRTLTIEDSGSGTDTGAESHSMQLWDTCNGTEGLSIYNSLIVNDIGSGGDASDVDYGHSKVVIRFTASKAEIKFSI